MNFITTALNKLFKSSNQQELNKIKPLVQKINGLEKDFINFTPEKFIEKTNQLKKNIYLDYSGRKGMGENHNERLKRTLRTWQKKKGVFINYLISISKCFIGLLL